MFTQVLLLGHHPPGGGDAIVLTTRHFEDLVLEYSDVIMLHVAGHTHNDHYKVVSQSEKSRNLHQQAENVMKRSHCLQLSSADGDPLSMTFINPSVTTYTNRNPSMRVFYIDETTYDVIDYEQYGFNVTAASGSTHNS